MVFKDTIAAIATALQPSGLGVIRISGPDAFACAEELFAPSVKETPVAKFPHHRLVHGWIMDGDSPVDEVLLTLMRAPHSYTSEDVVEIQAHGSVLGLKSILELVLSRGVRLARPGEFTERAFLSGRLDLTRVEALADLIHARSELGLRQAAQQLRGGLYDTIVEYREELVGVASLVEATIEFPDENVEFTSRGECLTRLRNLRERIDEMLAGASQARQVREGIGVALIGRPNVGKSSLLNTLLREPRAIVTHIPGTTRDTIEESLQIEGLAFRLTDTAGIRDSDDPVEGEGIRRSREAWEESDLTLLLLDASSPLEEEDRRMLENCDPGSTMILLNKIDLCLDTAPGRMAGLEAFETLPVSAKKSIGLEDLKKRIHDRATTGFVSTEEGAWLTNLRQQQAAERARNAVDNACQGLEEGRGEELVAVDLRTALNALGEIVGETTAEDLLERIFLEFCIGK